MKCLNVDPLGKLAMTGHYARCQCSTNTSRISFVVVCSHTEQMRMRKRCRLTKDSEQFRFPKIRSREASQKKCFDDFFVFLTVWVSPKDDVRRTKKDVLAESCGSLLFGFLFHSRDSSRVSPPHSEGSPIVTGLLSPNRSVFSVSVTFFSGNYFVPSLFLTVCWQLGACENSPREWPINFLILRVKLVVKGTRIFLGLHQTTDLLHWSTLH